MLKGEGMYSFFKNRYLVRICCADPEYILTRLTAIGVTIRNVHPIDRFTLQLEISGECYAAATELINRSGGKTVVIRLSGPAAIFQLAARRSVLICGIALMLLLTILIPTRIFFVSVEGNDAISTELLLQNADQLGLSFGASRKSVRSEKMKNALLQAMPDLKWVGINTYGCTAVISVLERDEADKDMPLRFGSIYATNDGIVSSITATKGTALCKPGQAISAGQLLISGYTDTGLVVRAEQAEGEVRAITQRKLEAIIPACNALRGEVSADKTRWALQFGKKRINLYIDSGNYDTGCGKIYKQYILTLPGGFQLPIALIKETTLRYSISNELYEPEQGAMQQLLREYILRIMIAGKILHEEVSAAGQDDIYSLTGKYVCEEMIGKLRRIE